jgi:enoyl-CoA hydratase
MTDYSCLEVTVSGQVMSIVLNRPRKRNALNDELIEELKAAIAAADDDRNVRAIVLSGAGEHFSAGFDLKESSYAKTDQPLEHYTWMIRNMRSTYQSVWNSRKPTIAKITGYCIAGGCYLQMLCDISIAADDAVLGHPAVVSGGVSAMPLWNWYLGARKAKEMLLTGKLIDGAEAARIGLVNAAVPRDRLDAEVASWVEQIISVPPDASVLCKEAINTAADVMGLSATFRTQGHLSALARYGEIDLDLDGLQAKTHAKVDAQMNVGGGSQ